jgi:hypothetical protein
MPPVPGQPQENPWSYHILNSEIVAQGMGGKKTEIETCIWVKTFDVMAIMWH